MPGGSGAFTVRLTLPVSFLSPDLIGGRRCQPEGGRLNPPKGGKMRRTRRALGAALAVFAAMPPGLALAQWNAPPSPYPSTHAWDGREEAAGGPAMAGALAPQQIVAGVRRAGFEPISRPIQRGRIYVLFAVDPYDVDVKLTVDAGSGRVLGVTDTVGPRYGGAGY